MAPLAKFRRHGHALPGCQCAVGCNPGDRQHLSVDEAKPLVIRADERLITRRDFDLPGTRHVEGIRAAQIQRHFLPSRNHNHLLVLSAHDSCGGGGPIGRGRECDNLPRLISSPVFFLLIGPAKRLLDGEACSFSGKDALQAAADRVFAIALHPLESSARSDIAEPRFYSSRSLYHLDEIFQRRIHRLADVEDLGTDRRNARNFE